VLPARFATCPPAALNVVFLGSVGFAASSFTSAKRTGSTILRGWWRATYSRPAIRAVCCLVGRCLAHSQPSTQRMHRSEVKEEAEKPTCQRKTKFNAAGGHERRCVRCGAGGHSDPRCTDSQSTRLNQSTDRDAETTAKIAASNAKSPEISVSFVSVEIRDESFSYTLVKSVALPA
jgi:hypothetical protein